MSNPLARPRCVAAARLAALLSHLAGHIAGVGLGSSHWQGALAGIAVALAEPVLREANLGHTPRALVGGGAPWPAGRMEEDWEGW